MNEQQLQTLRNLGNEAEEAADEIVRLRAALAMSPKATSGTSEREAFESWRKTLSSSDQYDYDNRGRGYKKDTGHMMELAWQARAALAANVPADLLARAVACLDRSARTREDLDALAALQALAVAPAPAPEAKPEAQQPAIIKLGAYGSAFDQPSDHRAYTYTHQPNNATAWVLGDAASRTVAGGDLIDHGLSLLQKLQAAGFGVFELAGIGASGEASNV